MSRYLFRTTLCSLLSLVAAAPLSYRPCDSSIESLHAEASQLRVPSDAQVAAIVECSGLRRLIFPFVLDRASFSFFFPVFFAGFLVLYLMVREQPRVRRSPTTVAVLEEIEEVSQNSDSESQMIDDVTSDDAADESANREAVPAVEIASVPEVASSVMASPVAQRVASGSPIRSASPVRVSIAKVIVSPVSSPKHSPRCSAIVTEHVSAVRQPIVTESTVVDAPVCQLVQAHKEFADAVHAAFQASSVMPSPSLPSLASAVSLGSSRSSSNSSSRRAAAIAPPPGFGNKQPVSSSASSLHSSPDVSPSLAPSVSAFVSASAPAVVIESSLAQSSVAIPAFRQRLAAKRAAAAASAANSTHNSPVKQANSVEASSELQGGLVRYAKGPDGTKGFAAFAHRRPADASSSKSDGWVLVK